ncbi:MAG TPA: PQQ-dependent dehydrogenase, methanol/ethanol family [Steroidobacteraceae bacterium]|nr:PQQ-dependent dehydrogenase, methanol/ethanol family [Steroidobacteraceae bacterium]
MNRRMITVALGLALGGCGQTSPPPAARLPDTKPAAAVDAVRMAAADREPGNWLGPGRDYGEQHFSPLKAIDAANIKQLGLAWFFDIDTAHRGQESTPLVVDGVMYFTSAWSKVFALDAKTGAPRWMYDPQVPGKAAVNACCDVVNRGAAAWKGRIYSGTLDGRLIALDAATGKLVWEVMTVPQGGRYTITGAPRVVKGMVLIGNGGGENGMRGYVTAYDADTGKQVWRFYTVPGDPSKPFENPALERAAKTWKGEWWTLGGGGPVWDAIVYDPTLDLIYIGVGNGAPWNRGKIRGDALYLSSIVALKADTGDYVWHYQTTPHDEWDFDACSPLILADLPVGGTQRAVIMQAPKNGFFYVLDRATGELLAADPFTTTTWAKSVNMKTGRPVVEKGANYGETGKPFVSKPGPGGGHSWQAMSFSPQTHLVYFPVADLAFPFVPEAHALHHDLAWNTGVDFDAGSLPQVPKIKAQILGSLKGHLVAWDPIVNKEVWRAELGHPWNGGVVSTAGNLVFQGTAMGEFVAYRADTGEKVWSAETQAGVLAAPISYEVDGEQYVAVEVGWGGAFGLAAGELALKSHLASNLPRMLVYKLGGSATLPALPAAAQAELNPPPETASLGTVLAGKKLYHTFCSTCHGDSATSSGVLPDLRYSPVIDDAKAMDVIVRQGSLQSSGMISFKDEVSAQDLEAIRAYVIHRANEDKRNPVEYQNPAAPH